MSGFTLDTSGFVMGKTIQGPVHWEWSHLTPFAQGYIEALFANAREVNGVLAHAGFSDLAPETLAQIIEECRFDFAPDPLVSSAIVGGLFWHSRQSGEQQPDFPPLSVTLGDDGKVRLAPNGDQDTRDSLRGEGS